MHHCTYLDLLTAMASPTSPSRESLLFSGAALLACSLLRCARATSTATATTPAIAALPQPVPQPLPVIDLLLYDGPDATPATRQRVTKLWNDAFATVGFAVLINNGVRRAAMDGLEREAKAYFSQNAAEKMKDCLAQSYGGGAGGFTPSGVEAVGRSRAVDGVDLEVEDMAADPVESYVRKREREREREGRQAREREKRNTV